MVSRVQRTHHNHHRQSQNQIHPHTQPQRGHKRHSTVHNWTMSSRTLKTINGRSMGSRTISRNPVSDRDPMGKFSSRQKRCIRVLTTPTVPGQLNRVTPRLGLQHRIKHHRQMISQDTLSAVHISNRLLDHMVIIPRPLGVTIKNCLPRVHLLIHHQLHPGHKVDGRIQRRDDEMSCGQL